MNLNYNFIECQQDRPGPILSNLIHYMVIGGGAGGDNAASEEAGRGGEFLTGSIDVAHLTTLEFQVGVGGSGRAGTPSNPILPTNGATSSLDYDTESISINAAGGIASLAPSCTGSVGCDAKGPWEIAPDYFGWAENGGRSTDSPEYDVVPYGGGVDAVVPPHDANFPFSNNADGNQKNAYNFTGGGGATGGGDSDDAKNDGGNGGNGMVALALYDPRDIFEVSIEEPSSQSGDLPDAYTFEKINGYKVWFFTHTASTGSFTLLGRRD